MSNKNKFNHKEAKLIKSCELFSNATNIVVGYGNPKADILFVGEAPGKKEDESGIPFSGAAGKNLDKLLEQVNLKREDIYIANILNPSLILQMSFVYCIMVLFIEIMTY